MGTYQVAAQYVKNGFSVIPIMSGDKRPLIKWKTYTERKPTDTELMALFSGQDYNIGIVTGPISGIVAVDIDDPKLYDSFIEKYPTEAVAHTPSGGYHLLYKYTGDDIGNSVSRLASGIDVRGRHGYIVAAPSRVKLAAGGIGTYTWLRSGDPKPLPQDLHDLILREMPKPREHGELNIENAGDDGYSLWSNVLVSGFTAHQHNVQVRDLSRFLTRMGMNDAAVINTLEALNRADETPLPASELRATVTSGINYERTRIAKRPKDGEPFVVKPLLDVLAEYEDKAQDWLIDGWLPARAIMVVTAPPENYKTWVALEAAVVTALGNHAKFLNGFEGPVEPQNVLIVQQEDYIAKTVERIRTILWSISKDLTYDFYMQKEEDGSTTYSFNTAWNAPITLHTDSLLSFDDDSSIASLERLIKDNNIKLVIIDPLYSMGAADDYFAALARKMIIMKRLRDKYGVTFLFVHHNKKGTKNGKVIDVKEREGMWGSQLLNGAFEGFWIINMAEGQRIITRTGKAYDGKQETFAIEFNINTNLAHVNDSGELDGEEPVYMTKLSMPTSNQMTEDETMIMNMINLLGEASHNQLVDETGLPKATITRAIRNLLALQAIKATPDTEKKRSKVYMPVEEH